jgi:phosphoglycerate kinase
VKLRSVRDLDAAGQRVFIRVDFNVPLQHGVVADDTKIRAALPTIQRLIDQGARVILASHLGRPDGVVVERLRMASVLGSLTHLLGRTVAVTDDCVGPHVTEAIERLEPGDVLLLENLRFHPGEEADDPAFAAALAANADVFVNDAFGTAHRAHASTVGIARHLPAYAGLLLEREVEVLSGLLEAPMRPFVTIVGGAKVSDKLAVIEHLVPKIDTLIVAGGLADTFLLAEGYAVGRSLAEPGKAADAGRVLAAAAARGVPVIVPIDVVAADGVREGATHRVVAVDEVERDESIVDIGPGSIRMIIGVLQSARTILWNGPLGVTEIDAFAHGTTAIAEELARCARRGTTVIVGGGDSIAAITRLGLEDRFTHLSTGGGASLEFLEGRDLPGVAVLREAALVA